MLWRDLVFDYLWERASALGRLLIITVILGAIAVLVLMFVHLGNARHSFTKALHEPITTSSPSIAPSP